MQLDDALINELVISLLEPPIFTKKPPSQVVLLPGSTLSLCCEAKGFPSPRIEWSHAQQSSDLPPAFQENGCLEVNTAKENSDGDYICRATNQFGLAETNTVVITAPLIGWIYSVLVTFDCSFIPLFENRQDNAYASKKQSQKMLTYI